MTEPHPQRYAYLRKEALAPYRGLRHFIYLSLGISGSLGAFIFLMQALAGKSLGQSLGNFALQVAVVAVMVGLFRYDQDRSQPPRPKD
jgi:hypothetical protein